MPLFTVIVMLLPLLAVISLQTAKADDNMFDTKEAALQKAQELGCEGAYQWEGVWLPCEEDNEGEDHSGHDHKGHGHSH
ncbi:MAG: hypothetical protein AB8B70_08535 [Prochlorococcus sp.]